MQRDTKLLKLELKTGSNILSFELHRVLGLELGPGSTKLHKKAHRAFVLIYYEPKIRRVV